MTLITRNKAILTALAVTVLAAPAGAFCRTTTCLSDPEAVCSWNDSGCIFEGVPLGWPLGATISLELDAASVDDRVAMHLEETLRNAAATWMAVRCESGESLGLGGAGGAGGETSTPPEELGGSSPDLKMKIAKAKGNVVVRPIADVWPYAPEILAKTTLAFGLESGTLDGATLELNLVDFNFTTEPSVSTDVDSQAVLTHELGHVMGLDHTLVHGATMESETTSAYSGRLSSLEPDDGDAICSLYPPMQSAEPDPIDLSPEVIPAESSGSTCQIAPSRMIRTPAAATLGLLLGLISLAFARRRSPARIPAVPLREL